MFTKYGTNVTDFLKTAKTLNVNTDFIHKIANCDIEGIPHYDDEFSAEIVSECSENPWYYFREVNNFNVPTCEDVLHLALLIKGYDTLRLGRRGVLNTSIPAYIHYVLKYTDIINNIAFVTNNMDFVKKPLEVFQNLQEADIQNHVTMLECPGYVSNEYTGRCCRIGQLDWLLVGAKYSIGVADLTLANPFTVATMLENLISAVKTSDDKTQFSKRVVLYKDIDPTEHDLCLSQALDSLGGYYDNMVFERHDLYKLLEKEPTEKMLCII